MTHTVIPAENVIPPMINIRPIQNNNESKLKNLVQANKLINIGNSKTKTLLQLKAACHRNDKKCVPNNLHSNLRIGYGNSKEKALEKISKNVDVSGI